MSTDDMRSYEPSAIKNAAELLTRGASLINEACPKCRGVQVKFKEVITCINCGHEQKRSKDVSSIHSKQRSMLESKGDSKSSPLEFIEDKITDKIVNPINSAKVVLDITIYLIFYTLYTETKLHKIWQASSLIGLDI